jgi:hypothetical protein
VTVSTAWAEKKSVAFVSLVSIVSFGSARVDLAHGKWGLKTMNHFEKQSPCRAPSRREPYRSEKRMLNEHQAKIWGENRILLFSKVFHKLNHLNS